MMTLALKYWKAGHLSVGDFTLIQLYMIGTFDKLWSMGKQVRAFYEALADASEMTEIINTPHEVEDAPGAKTLTASGGKIEFKNDAIKHIEQKRALATASAFVVSGQELEDVDKEELAEKIVANLDDFFKKIQLHALGGGIARKIKYQHFRLGP